MACRLPRGEYGVQPIPSDMFVPCRCAQLTTEALRGEGAYLRRPDGSRFMPDFDERAELAVIVISLPAPSIMR